MAIVRCAECNNEISDTAKQCPHCGAPKAKAIPPKSIGPAGWVAAAIVGAIAFSCAGSGGSGTSSTSRQQTSSFSELDALLLCQTALKRASRDPEKAEVPYVKAFGGSAEYYFAWGAQTKMARMRNGLGLEVAVGASCIVDKATRRITSLTLDGKTIM